MQSFLTRYRKGEHLQVWRELGDLGSRVFDSPHYEDACAVSDLTMQIAKRNLHIILERLEKLQYQFYDPLLKQAIPRGMVFREPSPETLNALSALESKVDQLPISLRSWFKIVGGVNFMGKFPSQNFEFATHYSDPLVLASAEDVLQELEFDEANRNPREIFQATLAPDKFLKVGEGGGPCIVELPCRSADFIFQCEKELMFVSYLRNALEWGAFPGFQEISPPPNRFISELTKDLEPL